MFDSETVVLNDAETISRSNWARDFVYSKALLNFTLRAVPADRVERAIYVLLGEFPSITDYKGRFLLNQRNPLRINPLVRIKRTLIIAFWIAAFLEIEKEISRVPILLEKLALRKNDDHFLLQRLRAIRNKSQSDYFSFELGSMQSSNVRVFQNVLLNGSGIIYLPDKSLYIPDPASNPRHSFVAGLWNQIAFNPSNGKITFLGSYQVGTPFQEYDRGIDLTGRCSNNYWHGLIEYAPRIILLSDKEALPVFISKNMPETVRQALSTIKPELTFIEIPEGQWIKVHELHVPRFHTKTFDSGTIPAPLMFDCDPQVLQDFSRRVVSNLIEGSFFVPKKVYLKRSSKFRNPLEINELEKFLESNGFVSIIPEECSFIEQVQIFQGAEVLVTFGGAAWANLIFGNPESTYISLTTEASAPYDMHEQIAKLLNLKYHQLISNSRVNINELSPFYRFYCHHSVKVTTEMLDKLKELLS